MQVGGITNARAKLLVALMMCVALTCALAAADGAWADDDDPPSISGAARIGQLLAVRPGSTERDSPNTTVFEWRSCTPGSSSCAVTGSGDRHYRYLVTAADAGKTLVVHQVITWPSKKQTILKSAPTAIVPALPPVTPPKPTPTPPKPTPTPPKPTPTPAKPSPTPTPTPTSPKPPAAPSQSSPPKISGEAQVGRTLVADEGAWSSALPVTFTYQWRRCAAEGDACAGIEGATSRTYLIGIADVGARLLVAVTARSAAGSASGTSASTEPVRATQSQGAFDQAPDPPSTGSGSNSGGEPTPSAPSPPVAGPQPPPRLAPVVVRFAGSFSGHATVFKLVSVRVPARATVEARCAGRGCGQRVRNARLRSGVTRLRWLERRYRPGDSIVLRVRRSGRIGAYTRVIVRRGAAPQRRDACLRPGAMRPMDCPAR